MTDASSSTRRTVRVELGDRSYDILIGPGLIAAAGSEIAARLKGRRIAVVTDEHVGPIYLDPFMRSLSTNGIEAVSLVLKADLIGRPAVGRSSASRLAEGDGEVELPG